MDKTDCDERSLHSRERFEPQPKYRKNLLNPKTPTKHERSAGGPSNLYAKEMLARNEHNELSKHRINKSLNNHSPLKGMMASAFVNADHETQMKNMAFAMGMPNHSERRENHHKRLHPPVEPDPVEQQPVKQVYKNLDSQELVNSSQRIGMGL